MALLLAFLKIVYQKNLTKTWTITVMAVIPSDISIHLFISVRPVLGLIGVHVDVFVCAFLLLSKSTLTSKALNEFYASQKT